MLETRVQALLNQTTHSQLARHVDRLHSHTGWKALGMAAPPALTWATLHLITTPSIVIKALQGIQDWDGVPLVDRDEMLDS